MRIYHSIQLLIYILLLVIALMVVQLVQMATVWKPMDQSRHMKSSVLRCDRGRRNPARPKGTSMKPQGMRPLEAGAKVAYKDEAGVCITDCAIIIMILCPCLVGTMLS